MSPKQRLLVLSSAFVTSDSYPLEVTMEQAEEYVQKLDRSISEDDLTGEEDLLGFAQRLAFEIGPRYFE